MYESKCSIPLLLNQWKCILKNTDEYLSIKMQNRLLSFIEMNTGFEQYEYTLLKLYIREIEKNNCEIGDKLCEKWAMMCKSASYPKVGRYFQMRKYYFGPSGGNPLQLYVSNSFEQVGEMLWDASLFIIEYAKNRPDVFRGKCILGT